MLSSCGLALLLGREAPAAATVESVSLNHLLAAKKLAEQLGGNQVARQALASFAKLME